MAGLINVSIDLTKIDKTKIFEKDGKKWLSLSVSINNECDQYGNNASITVGQSKEERERKDKRCYLGNGKVTWTDGLISVASPNIQSVLQSVVDGTAQENDLPF